MFNQLEADDAVVGSAGFMEKLGLVGGGLGEDLVNVLGVEDGVDAAVTRLARGLHDVPVSGLGAHKGESSLGRRNSDLMTM